MMMTNVNINSASSMALRAIVHTFVIARLQQNPVLARVFRHFVGAFGVMGFLRVKDEQKSVLHADASASARLHSSQSQKGTKKKQNRSRLRADLKQGWSKATASLKQHESRSRNACPSI